MEIIVNNGTISEEEKNNYVKYVSEKIPIRCFRGWKSTSTVSLLT